MTRQHDWRADLDAARRLYQAARLFYRRYWYQLNLMERGQQPRFYVSWERLKTAIVAGMHRIVWWRLWRMARSNSVVAAHVWSAFATPSTLLQPQT